MKYDELICDELRKIGKRAEKTLYGETLLTSEEIDKDKTKPPKTKTIGNLFDFV